MAQHDQWPDAREVWDRVHGSEPYPLTASVSIARQVAPGLAGVAIESATSDPLAIFRHDGLGRALEWVQRRPWRVT